MAENKNRHQKGYLIFTQTLVVVEMVIQNHQTISHYSKLEVLKVAKVPLLLVPALEELVVLVTKIVNIVIVTMESYFL